MKELKLILSVLCILSVFMFGNLIADYDDIDEYNKVTNSYSWVSHLSSDAEGVVFMGEKEHYYIRVNSNRGIGVIDKHGNVILPCNFFAADYRSGDYMAAATIDKWILMDCDGKEISSLNRISFPYAYAGDKYFIKYGNDAIEDVSDGFTIIDAVSGNVVKEYNDYYNAILLDDGNWYICKTVEAESMAVRRVLSQMNFYTCDYPDYYSDEAEMEDSKGYFADENFEPLYGGKEYRLIAQGEGIYVAKTIDQDDKNEYVVLDENGELFSVTDDTLKKRIMEYEKNGDGIEDSITVFRHDDGSIGFVSINNVYDVLYYSDEGELKGDSKVGENMYASGRENLIIFTVKEKEEFFDEYYTITKLGIKNNDNGIILPAVYSDLLFLPETENIMINNDKGCGIIRLEVN